LLRAGANPNAADKQNSTPIMFAAQHDYATCVQALVEAGANLNAQGTHGLTALGFAEQNGHQDLANWLRARGATS